MQGSSGAGRFGLPLLSPCCIDTGHVDLLYGNEWRYEGFGPFARHADAQAENLFGWKRWYKRDSPTNIERPQFKERKNSDLASDKMLFRQI